MRKHLRILTLLVVLATATVFAQTKKEWGSKFDYDIKTEIDPKVVLADNYNHYMISVINKDGMLGQNKIIIRKFDQKNTLVNTFIQEFPYKDMFTLHNYLGSFELGKDKVVVFTDSYSNKTKKKEIHKVVFDKNTDTFTTTLVVGFIFESLSKSGTAYVVGSQNGAYIGVIYSKFSNKKIAEVDECTVLNATTLDVAWQKTVAFPLEFYSGDITLTNSGKLVFVKRVVSKSEKHSLLVVDASSETDKDLGANIKISRPLAISIGTQDYLIAFNFEARLREWAYSNIMLYDLQSGKILNNDKIVIFPGIKDIQDVKYNYVNVHDNQIDLFTESKYQTGSMPSTAFPNDPKFNDPVYTYGSGTVIVMDTEGKLKSNDKLDVIPFGNELVYSFGVFNQKGNYYINTAGFTERGVEYASFYQLTPETYTSSKKSKIDFVYNVSEEAYLHGSFIHQFVNYFPDSKRILFAKYFSDGKIAFVSYFGVTF